METLEIKISSAQAPERKQAAICGVVGSGNLEVLVRPGEKRDQCLFKIKTAASGFATTWQGVVQAFCQEHKLGGTEFLIQDMGATPAVVNLRLSQALETYLEGK